MLEPELASAATSTGPRRNSLSGPPVAATMVDSMPRFVAPPSTISEIRPPRLFSTCSARVGLIEPTGVCRGGGKRPAASPQQRLHRRMVRHADSDVRQAGSDEGNNRRIGSKRDDERQRTWPVRPSERERLVAEFADPLRCAEVWYMDDERIEARAALCLVDAGDRLCIRRVGGKTVDRLRWHGDRFAGEDQPCGLGNAVVIAGDNFGRRHAELVSASIVESARSPSRKSTLKQVCPAEPAD